MKKSRCVLWARKYGTYQLSVFITVWYVITGFGAVCGWNV